MQVYVYDLNVNKYEPLCEQSGKNVGLVSYRPIRQSGFRNQGKSGIQALGIRIQLKEPEILLKIGIWRNPSSTDKQSRILDIINFTDQLKFLGKCPPTPPLSQHFALSEK